MENNIRVQLKILTTYPEESLLFLKYTELDLLRDEFRKVINLGGEMEKITALHKIINGSPTLLESIEFYMDKTGQKGLGFNPLADYSAQFDESEKALSETEKLRIPIENEVIELIKIIDGVFERKSNTQ